MAACHLKGWCINDLRLPNVLILADKSWHIVDAEMAQKIGSSFPDIKGGPAHLNCRPETGRFMLSRMLDTLADWIPFDGMLRAMHMSLKKQKRGVVELLRYEEWQETNCHGRHCMSC